ncbi:MAG: response regulator [Proteobacteria bacterium]|nr:response regulator [Pseudomonadota bacterium]MBU1581587.1 response regulator [Pseudomonadota bacterium]MBU2628007.1 response regulator [Pseudomonadota bacterium]
MPTDPLDLWFQTSTDLFFINVCTTLFVAFLFQEIEKSDREAKASSKLLLVEQVDLIDSKNKLEKEFKERKQSEKALLENNELLTLFIRHSPVYCYIKDVNPTRSVVLQASDNYQQMIGIPSSKMIGRAMEDLFPPEFAAKITADDWDVVSKGDLLRLDEELNGRSYTSIKFPIVQGDKILLAGYTIDITERKLDEAEKLTAQKIADEHGKQALIGRIAGKMAHDFNNILGIIMGNTELSLVDCKDAETRKTLELIFEQTVRGKNLTKNLVAFAKDQEPKQEFFRISEKIDLVLNLMRKDLTGIELLKEERPGVPELLADPGMIEHALVNLIQNSIHAISMVENPRITLRTYSRENHICFEIEDNGCGISKENLENIYEPSFTLKGSKDVSGSYKAGIKGTGYGMSNIKKYIEQHNGIIFVESELGSGTKFTISLPVIKKELTSEEKKEIQKEIAHFKKHILVVEDETAIAEVQYTILTQKPCNHKVDIANNGQVALDLLNRNEYDLISLDYVLPGKFNGMDIYHHVRETNKNIPIFFISGNIEFLESIKDLKKKDPYIGHLSKPCKNIDYVNGINQLFGTVAI